MSADKTFLIAQIEIDLPVEQVWMLWTLPEHIIKWNNASADWYNEKVENDLRPEGKFLFVMARKDKKESFNFEGTYNEVVKYKRITYTLNDDRRSIISFEGSYPTKLTETFQAEPNHPLNLQKDFCQAVLNRFKQYALTQI